MSIDLQNLPPRTMTDEQFRAEVESWAEPPDPYEPPKKLAAEAERARLREQYLLGLLFNARIYIPEHVGTLRANVDKELKKDGWLP